jgi:hypothetical protein
VLMLLCVRNLIWNGIKAKSSGIEGAVARLYVLVLFL